MIFNVPNMLTLVRVLLIPVFIFAAFSASSQVRLVGALAFGIAALTDWLDGLTARKLNQVSEIGKIADPIADRILIASALIVLYIKISDIVPLWTILIVIGRDLLMVLGWVYISYLGTRIKVTYEGKLATAILMFSVFFLMINVSDKFTLIGILGIGLFYVGVILSVVSGVRYFKLGLDTIRNSKNTT